MKYMNPPTVSPKNITHKTFYSHVLSHEIGYNIYLPADYWESNTRYPTVYHIHGWQGNESSEIWSMEKVCRNKQAITVFINAISSKDTFHDALLQIETIFIKELIPHIDGLYKTIATRESRMLSGFSMGGAMAVYYAIKNMDYFRSVISYAGAYHLLFHKDYHGVGKPPEMAIELYEKMIHEERYLEEHNILYLVQQNVNNIRRNLHIDIHVGTSDMLFCDNEIMHLYLNSLNIPHNYKKFDGVEHDLDNIL